MGLLTRAAVPSALKSTKRKLIKPSLGNLKSASVPGGKGRVSAGTQAINYVSEGTPLNVDWGAEELAREGYLSNVYVMRCIRLIAETIAGLPYVEGPDPTNPSNFEKTGNLANMLGPSTPQAPGGPNPRTSSRAFWLWSICQYLVTGRFGWECQLDGPTKATQEVIGLWPLVSAALAPKPTMGGTEWFNGFEYSPATGYIELTNEQVVYCWRPSISDWRMPESVLQAATMPVFIATSINKYIGNLLKNNLVATTLVVSPPMDEADVRRAWQDQFLAEFTGVDRAGTTIFAEVEADPKDAAGKPLVQVERLGMNAADAQLNTFLTNAQNDICISCGVPRSLIGDASQRTYANACPRASELIRLANGERHMAKDLVGKTFDLLTSTPEGPKRVEGYATWANIEESYAVTTESGRRIEVNGRHPLFAGRHLSAAEYRERIGRKPGRPPAGTGDSPERRAVRNAVHVDQLGWTKVQDLSEGDLVAVTTEFPVEGNDPMTLDEATVLGALIGDGCSTGTNITLTSPDSVEVQTFTAAVERLGDRVTKYKRREGATDTWGIAGGNVRKLLSTHGLLGLKGHHKFVPSSVFAARREVQVAFLQALYAADGCAHWAKAAMYGGSSHPARAMVDLTSVSETLVRDVQELLIQFGVSARIIPQKTSFTKGSKKFPSFRLCIQVADEVLRFIDEVGIPAKSYQVKETRKVAQAQADRGNQRSRWRVSNVNNGLRWEKIKSIESLGIDQHVCIEVPDGHTYLSTFWEHNSSEYKNFWTLTILDLLAELQDHVNQDLAPRVGDTVGWWDLSRVSAVQAPSMFAPPDIASVIETGVATAAQIANVLGIPAEDATTDSDVETVEVGEEASNSTSMGGKASADMADWQVRSIMHRWTGEGRADLELRAMRDPTMLRYYDEVLRRRQAPINTYTIRGLRKPWEPLEREHIKVAPIKVRATVVDTDGPGYRKAADILDRVDSLRALKVADDKTKTVHDVLSENYPESTLGWVDDADWSGPQDVDLDDIDMGRRPGGRDQAKVQGIAKGIAQGAEGAVAPVVLVATPGSDKLQVADGYHRTLARRRVGHTKLPAYVGKVDSDTGPWDEEMHDAKLNRADVIDIEGRYDTSPLGHGGHNFVTKGGGLPSFVRAVAHALQRTHGVDESTSIQMAIGAMQRWAHGGDHVTPKTIAKAQEALADWERLKAGA